MRFGRIARLLGNVFQVYAAFLVIPLAGSLLWDQAVAASALTGFLPFPVKLTTASFGIVLVFVFLLGLLLTTVSPPIHEDLREREAFFVVGAGWLFCAVLGALPFLLTGATREPTVALFESMSAITTTGFSALEAPLEDYPESVHLWRAALHFFGGLGIVLVAVAVIGRLTEGAVKLLSTEIGGGDVARLRPTLSQTAKSLFTIYIGVNLLAFALYVLAIHYTGERHDWKSAAFHALVHSLGTIATGGMSSRTDSVAAFDSALLGLLVGVFALASGMSFVGFYRALHGGIGAVLRNAELHLYMLVILGATLAVAGFLIVDGRSLGAAAAYAPFTAVTTITTTGYTVTNPDAFPDGAKLVLLLLMFTGGMVGSTAGGIKVARINLLLRLTARELQRLLHPHAVAVVKVGGRIFPEESMRRIVVFFFSFVTVFIGGALGFAFLGFDFETAVTASIATLSNIGYGFAGVGAGFADVGPAAQMLGFMLMWLGRLEIFTVLLLFVPATYRD